MPWIKRSHKAKNYFWIVGGVGLAAVATVVGYQLGNTTSVVDVVEKHLANSEAQVRRLEKRVQALEAKLGVESAEARAKPGRDVN